MSSLLTNIHETAEILKETGNSYLVSGTYEYYHYLCDGFDDRGWGCGYRTLQTICSWMSNNQGCDVKVPSIREIQDILVQLEDKSPSFSGSRQWIGSFEDPHYVGKEKTKEFLFHKGWVKWQRLSDFLDSSFYNLCLPQVKAKSKHNE